jgi:hypothetical protein
VPAARMMRIQIEGINEGTQDTNGTTHKHFLSFFREMYPMQHV